MDALLKRKIERLETALTEIASCDLGPVHDGEQMEAVMFRAAITVARNALSDEQGADK